MKKISFILLLVYCAVCAKAQTPYRATATRCHDLVHTKLAVRFDYQKCQLYGQEWVTLRPHAYASDSLRLDAKGMDIHAVALSSGNKLLPLKYSYEDSLALKIHLTKVYKSGEQFTVYISYTAKPNAIHQKGSAAITAAKGLYFINPDSAEKGKPVQVWTQGETESASCWFPTIDKPNQKSTGEIAMTVPAKYVTLSNGRLASQRRNNDGTRTDTWKMERPHAPYLFMMAVGNFKVYHDHWQNKPVDYYLEPQYAPYAKAIFGRTPEMISYYSQRLGVPFPWNKYAQIVCRDYVSGAMENTTATLHGEYVQETPRELADNGYDAGQSTIAHELFHQWFGDLVTCESWSNLTLNESFADFSESLWADHYFGKDEGDAHRFGAVQAYLHTPGAPERDLVRFYYKDREDMFDPVSYAKGGRILDMLRNYLGDAVFFKGLHLYLTANAFKSAEAQQLRLAMEEASGQDLNWFFNEWYYGSGHPVLDISYHYSNNQQIIVVKQLQQKLFHFRVAVDIYNYTKVERHRVWCNGPADTLRFAVAAKPDLVNFDADKILLCEKTDHKTATEYAFQYAHAPLYRDRLEALDTAIAYKDTATIIAALHDQFWDLRLAAVNGAPANDIKTLAITDPDNRVRAAAINRLAPLRDPHNKMLFETAANSNSYAVEGAGLNGMAWLDPKRGFELAKKLDNAPKGGLTEAILQLYLAQGNDQQWAFVNTHYPALPPQSQYNFAGLLAGMCGRLNSEHTTAAIGFLRDFAIRFKSSGVAPQISGLLLQVQHLSEQRNDQTAADSAKSAIEKIKAI